MDEAIITKVHSWLKDHEQELIEDCQTLLQFPSVESTPEPDAPFGRPVRDALNWILTLSKKWGMQTKDLDGYAGYAEFGSGEKLIMSLGHLDVVPVGSGWKHDPFGAEMDQGYLYARGAVDDKGPTIAALYAVRALKECVPNLPARIRAVFGCDEESGFECIKHYLETEEVPTYGIAPDASWPLYHAEKGIADLILSVPKPKGGFELLEASGGERPNIVMDCCQAKVKISPAYQQEVKERLMDAWDKNLHWNWNQDTLEIQALGKAAHGSKPFAGDSAAIRLFRFLSEIAPIELTQLFVDILNTMQISGAGLGISCKDEVSKDLTSNIGILKTKEDDLLLLFNIRYPVTWKGDSVLQTAKTFIQETYKNYDVIDFKDSSPLYVPLDHPLVKTLADVYTKETGEHLKPRVTGGGTYARAVPNTVAVGTGWEGDGKEHEPNERIKAKHLLKMSQIYAHMLYRMAFL